jgi:hypothetical protein
MARWQSRNFILPLPGIFKEMYLDTNVWSELAKGNRSANVIDRWLQENSGFLAFTGFAALELSTASRLIEGLADFISKHRTVMLRHGDHELTGRQIFWASYYDLFLPIDLNDTEHRHAFIDEMRNGTIVNAAAVVRQNKTWLKSWIENAVLTSPRPGRNPWRRFNDLLYRWLEARTSTAGYKLHADAIVDSTRYRGQKLQFAFLFERFYISGKKWQDSDFVDFLHLQDMAYADAVVTEYGLAYSLTEIARNAPGVAPPEIYTLDWLGPRV